MHRTLEIERFIDPETGERSQRETVRVVEHMPGVMTQDEAAALQAAADAQARRAETLGELARLDAQKIRALSDALLVGIDTPINGETPRDRLAAIETAQAELRRKLADQG